MPAKSSKQYRYMQMKAHETGNVDTGPSKAVAREMISKTSPKKRKMYSKRKHNSGHSY